MRRRAPRSFNTTSALDTDDDTDDEPLIEGDDDDAKLRKLAVQVEALAAK
jgi:hypothetical protein